MPYGRYVTKLIPDCLQLAQRHRLGLYGMSTRIECACPCVRGTVVRECKPACQSTHCSCGRPLTSQSCCCRCKSCCMKQAIYRSCPITWWYLPYKIRYSLSNYDKLLTTGSCCLCAARRGPDNCITCMLLANHTVCLML